MLRSHGTGCCCHSVCLSHSRSVFEHLTTWLIFFHHHSSLCHTEHCGEIPSVSSWTRVVKMQQWYEKQNVYGFQPITGCIFRTRQDALILSKEHWEVQHISPMELITMAIVVCIDCSGQCSRSFTVTWNEEQKDQEMDRQTKYEAEFTVHKLNEPCCGHNSTHCHRMLKEKRDTYLLKTTHLTIAS